MSRNKKPRKAYHPRPGQDAETITQTFIGTPMRKLRDLLAVGWKINGVCFRRTEENGAVRRGAATTGGMILWWPADHPASKPLTDEHRPSLCINPICRPTCRDCNCALSAQDQAKYAMRYAYLRGRDLNAIDAGGVFAGMTPSNVVLNGDDLDAEIDRAIEAAHGIKGGRMNREQRRAAKFKRHARWDRNAALAEPAAALNRIVLAQPYTDGDFARLSNDARLCWHRLSSGDGTDTDFQTLGGMLNTAAVVAEGIDPLVFEAIERGQIALVAMQARHARLGRWGADAQALQALPEALDVLDEIMRNSTPLQMVAALRESVRRQRVGIVIDATSLEVRR